MHGFGFVFQANFKESYMATFYDYFNEQKYADAVKNVSSVCEGSKIPAVLLKLNPRKQYILLISQEVCWEKQTPDNPYSRNFYQIIHVNSSFFASISS